MLIPSRSDFLLKIHYHHLVTTYQNCRNRVFCCCFILVLLLNNKCTQKQYNLVAHMALHEVTKCKELAARKQINTKLFCSGGPKQYQPFPVLSCLFKYLFHRILPYSLGCAVQTKSRARAGFSRQLRDPGRRRRAGLTADKRDRTKTEPSFGTLLVFHGLLCFSLFSYPLEGRPFDSFCFVLCCFVFHIDHVVSQVRKLQ